MIPSFNKVTKRSPVHTVGFQQYGSQTQVNLMQLHPPWAPSSKGKWWHGSVIVGFHSQASCEAHRFWRFPKVVVGQQHVFQNNFPRSGFISAHATSYLGWWDNWFHRVWFVLWKVLFCKSCRQESLEEVVEFQEARPLSLCGSRSRSPVSQPHLLDLFPKKGWN